jgi:hypothetical protein
MLLKLKPSTVFKLGALALSIAMMINHGLHLTRPGATDLEDATGGFIYGIAIGLLALSVWMMQRSKQARS